MSEYHKIHTLFKRDEQNRIIPDQYSRDEFVFLRKNDWLWTEKVDGTNIRVTWAGDCVTFGGRTDRAQLYAPLAKRLQELFPAEKFQAMSFTDVVTLYGEGYGAGIQKGVGYKYGGVDFVLFDVRVGDWWLRREDVESLGKSMSVDVVPVVGVGPLGDAVELVATGFTSERWPQVKSEGLVVRPMIELKNRAGERVITKVKTVDFEKLNGG